MACSDERDFLLDPCEEAELVDYSQWMTNLPKHLADTPINQLAIPGSHDSGAYYLNPDSPIAPDESKFIKTFGKCAKKVVIRWGVTQALTITDQLNGGVRYFDMRNGYLSSEDDYFFVHGIYGHKISEMLEEIAKFLKAHPKEIVIVDFNHFYSFTPALHQRFAKMISATFNGMMYSQHDGKGMTATLSEIWASKKQVFVSYDNAQTCKTFTDFWFADSIVFSPWPNTASVDTLIRSLDKRFSTLEKGKFNVFQAILTPQTSTIIFHLASSLRSYLAGKCDKNVTSWLQKVYNNRTVGMNIMICDFICTDVCVPYILKLNQNIKAVDKS